jgi:competence protein ComGC
MNPHHNSHRRGFSSTELLIIILAVALVVVWSLPLIAKRRARPSTASCIGYVKQIGLGFRLWATDHGGKYPMQVSRNEGGTMELVASGAVFPHFAVMSNELSTPGLLVCPQDWLDSGRKRATNFARLSDSNISYFVGLDSNTNLPQMWLCGDRNLAVNDSSIKPGLFVFKANKLLSWTTQMHNNKGNLCFDDGSVQQVANANLQRSATNALRSYFEATTNASFRLAIP